jgi:monomeric isocitrate dehydrogenase
MRAVVRVLKPGIRLQAGEVVDTAVMNVAALRAFYAASIQQAKKDNLLLSLHLKCTMMKVSGPDHVRPLRLGVFSRTRWRSMPRRYVKSEPT